MSRPAWKKNKCLGPKGTAKGKAKYHSSAEAEHDARAHSTPRDERSQFAAYFCQTCWSWHIGHVPKKSSKPTPFGLASPEVTPTP